MLRQNVETRCEAADESRSLRRVDQFRCTSLAYRLRVSQPLGIVRHVEGKHELDCPSPATPNTYCLSFM